MVLKKHQPSKHILSYSFTHISFIQAFHPIIQYKLGKENVGVDARILTPQIRDIQYSLTFYNINDLNVLYQFEHKKNLSVNF